MKNDRRQRKYSDSDKIEMNDSRGKNRKRHDSQSDEDDRRKTQQQRKRGDDVVRAKTNKKESQKKSRYTYFTFKLLSSFNLKKKLL